MHGLGGSSEKTWCYDGDSNRFWPKLWLPLEPEISSARIMSFGYNADYMNTGPNNVSSISDFARDLLFHLKFGRDIEDRNNLDIGKVGSFDPDSNSFCSLVYQRPIIFVVHSMGGLVFKKVGALPVTGLSLIKFRSSICDRSYSNVKGEDQLSESGPCIELC